MATGCYKDKGNYIYEDIGNVEVRVSGIDSLYRVKTKDILKITPAISPDNSEYECFWGIFPASDGDVERMTIISREKNLEYPVILKPGSYKMRFFAKNKTTGVTSYTQYEIVVETEIVKGWWLLKELNGKTDMDIHTDEKSFYNRLSSISGSSIDGKPLNFLFSNSWLHVDSIVEGDKKKYIETEVPSVFVVSDKDIKVIDFYTNEPIGNFETLFKLVQPIEKKPEDIFFASWYISIVNNGKIHSIRTVPASSAITYCGEGLKGNYKLASSRAVAFYWQPMLYDENASSFCTYARIDNSMQYYKDPHPYKVNNLNADLLFFNNRKMVYLSKWAYALLRSKSKPEHYLYKFSSVPSAREPLVLGVDTIKQDKKMFHAEKYAYTKGYNQTFFSIGNEIWSCEFAGFLERKQLSVPSDETITYIETLVPEVPWGTQAPTYFTMATHKGGRYKFYIYLVQAGNIDKLLKIEEGEGVVKRSMLLEMSGSNIFQTFLD